MNSRSLLLIASVVLLGPLVVNCSESSSVPQRKSYEDYIVLSVAVDDVDKYLAIDEVWGEKVDFWDGSRIANLTTRIMIHRNDQQDFEQYLTGNGFTYSVAIQNVETVFASQRRVNNEKRMLRAKSGQLRDLDLTYFWDYEEIMEYIDAVALEYPDIVTVERLLDSYEGRRIVSITITAPGENEDRPIILIDSTIHAREWAAPMVMLYLIRELTENYGEHEDNLELIKFVIIPVVNVDGYQYSFDSERLWRKTRTINEGSDCIGVDGNRNYDHKWEEGNFDPCSIIFSGTAPFSEPETRNVRNVIENNTPKIAVYISTHTYGNLLLYPFSSTTSTLPENYEEQEQVGRIFARAVAERFNTAYRVGNGANLLSIASGTSKDWAFPQVRLPYTLELPGGGNNGFDIEFDRIENVGLETVDGFIALADYVSENFEY